MANHEEREVHEGLILHAPHLFPRRRRAGADEGGVSVKYVDANLLYLGE